MGPAYSASFQQTTISTPLASAATISTLFPADPVFWILRALQHGGPALVEILVSRQELSMPPTITVQQMKGFGLFASKAVLSGRSDEIIDLAKINLFG
jgi:hypothetical protein